ncbi:Acylphosphatase, partial [Polychaeton citri CBS 116435]
MFDRLKGSVVFNSIRDKAADNSQESTDIMSSRISYKVEGIVQGVNFRSWTADKANNLRLTGYVRNADDGSVVGEAQGDKSSLDKFVQNLHIGPSASKVSKVDKEEIDTKDGENGFRPTS